MKLKSTSIYLQSFILSITLFILLLTHFTLFQNDFSYFKVLSETPGYILITHSSDQLTSATRNMFSLQCWAATLPGNVKVVEPFLHRGSFLGLELDPNLTTRDTNKYRIFDLFDADSWKGHAAQNNFSFLESWEKFIENAPHQLILVDKTCPEADNLCMRCNRSDFFESPYFQSSALKFANYYKFRIVRRVCYNALEQYSDEEFKNLVYGTYRPGKSVVIFNRFGGFDPNGSRFRIHAHVGKCVINSFINIPVSRTVTDLASSYSEKFLLGANSNKGYISVMIRTERLMLKYSSKATPTNSTANNIFTCISRVVKLINKIKQERNLSNTFIATDTGQYGSYGNRYTVNYRKSIIDSAMKRLHDGLYGNKVYLASTLESLALHLIPGQVAFLDKTIAANGTCLVLVGGGTFHQTVANLYLKKFEDKSNTDACLIRSPREC